jgi:hypothetical protein
MPLVTSPWSRGHLQVRVTSWLWRHARSGNPCMTSSAHDVTARFVIPMLLPKGCEERWDILALLYLLNFAINLLTKLLTNSCVLEHNGLNGHSRPLLWWYQSETTPQYSPETPSTHDIWGTKFWLQICQPYWIVRPDIDFKLLIVYNMKLIGQLPVCNQTIFKLSIKCTIWWCKSFNIVAREHSKARPNVLDARMCVTHSINLGFIEFRGREYIVCDDRWIWQITLCDVMLGR